MDYIDYSIVISLFKEYKNKFQTSFTAAQKDLAGELEIKLNTLEEVSAEIIDLINALLSLEDLTPDEDGIIKLGPFQIRLERADPNIPIQLDNVTRAYASGEMLSLSSEKQIKMERRLERLTNEFYQIAHRVAHITKNLPKLNLFESSSVRIIRNHLIEHPEKKDSGVTYSSFSYSKNEGPYVKGIRKDGQAKHVDKGFKENSHNFIAGLKDTIEKAIAE